MEEVVERINDYWRELSGKNARLRTSDDETTDEKKEEEYAQ